MNAEILTYSRARGAFAGLTLNGASIRRDDDSTEAIYGHDVSNARILNGEVAIPARLTRSSMRSGAQKPRQSPRTNSCRFRSASRALLAHSAPGCPQHFKKGNICSGQFVVILILWLLGFSFHLGGGLIHLLLVVALVVLVFNLISGRRRVL